MESYRKHPRIRTPKFLVRVSTDGRMEAMAQDLSRGGMFIRSASPPAVGTDLAIHLLPPKWEHPLILPGKVVRRVDENTAKSTGQPMGMGIEFSSLPEEEATRLEALLAEYGPGSQAAPSNAPAPRDWLALEERLEKSLEGERRAAEKIEALQKEVEALVDAAHSTQERVHALEEQLAISRAARENAEQAPASERTSREPPTELAPKPATTAPAELEALLFGGESLAGPEPAPPSRDDAAPAPPPPQPRSFELRFKNPGGFLEVTVPKIKSGELFAGTAELPPLGEQVKVLFQVAPVTQPLELSARVSAHVPQADNKPPGVKLRFEFPEVERSALEAFIGRLGRASRGEKEAPGDQAPAPDQGLSHVIEPPPELEASPSPFESLPSPFDPLPIIPPPTTPARELRVQFSFEGLEAAGTVSDVFKAGEQVGGIYVRTSDPPPFGSQVLLTVEAPSGNIEIEAEVVHVVQPTGGASAQVAGMGVQFAGGSPELRQRLTELLSARTR